MADFMPIRLHNVYCDRNRIAKPKPLSEVFRGRPHLERLLARSKPHLKKDKIGRQGLLRNAMKT
jgi:hypothetical protein